MKAIGIVRRVDDLGRIVIPKELRRSLCIEEGDPLEIYVDGNQVILKKYEPTCIFCGEGKDIKNFNRKNICPSCIKKIGKL
ncbi:AbrB/MazE/SpoVT family DNA-binding domain-containing protein [Clostridium subterminale]|uniref:AbrB/MazE/SpoVT family DNA-binding domain-containing protein n=1 Tax=Clostridium subterminale TaxID=1550 RepID=A0ABP3W0M0_CLOSU